MQCNFNMEHLYTYTVENASYFETVVVTGENNNKIKVTSIKVPYDTDAVISSAVTVQEFKGAYHTPVFRLMPQDGKITITAVSDTHYGKWFCDMFKTDLYLKNKKKWVEQQNK